LIFPQYIILIAALVLASEAAPPTHRRQATPADIANAEITKLEHFEYKSVDSGDAESHYKTFELLVHKP
jgi:hypothetical protein